MAPEVERRYGAQITGFILEMNEGRGSTTFNRIGKRLFVDKNASENTELKKGLEIISINGLATDEVLSRLAEYITSDGNNYEKKLERLSVTGEEKFAMFDIFYPIEFSQYQVH